MDDIDIAIIFMLMESETEDTDDIETEKNNYINSQSDSSTDDVIQCTKVEQKRTLTQNHCIRHNSEDVQFEIHESIYQGEPKSYFSRQRQQRFGNIEHYVKEVIPQYSLSAFKSHFRITVQQFQRLLDLIGPGFHRLGNKYPLEKFLLLCLWILANSESYRGVGDRFNLPKSSVSRYLRDFSNLVSKHGNHLINWPKNEEISETIKGFHNLGFPNTLGSIDSCHISINKPFASNVSDPDSYFNKKNYFSINLMATCNAEMKFTYIDVGSPGKLQDSTVLNLSELGRIMEYEPHLLFPEGTHLIGGSSFPLGRYLMTPFRDNGHLSKAQKRYNLNLSRAKNVIEKAFELLKCRFGRLNHIQMNTVENVALTIKSCCILHNLCIDDTSEFCDDYEESGNVADVCEEEFDFETEIDVSGVYKRNEMLSSFV